MRSRIRRVLLGRLALAATLGAVGLASVGARADDAPLVVGDASGGGLEVRTGAGGLVVARVPVATPALRRGPPTAREVLVDDRRVLEVRVPVRGTANVEVWVGELGAREPRVIWKGLTGPRDADGETSVALDVSPDGIVEFQTAGSVSRCDGEPVRLFPRAFDFDGGRFRPVLSPLPSPAAVTLVARRGDPAMPAGRPVGAFHFTAASTTLAAGSDARGLTAPTALDDGDPATAWAEGLGGDGRGEFLTARAVASGTLVRGLRFIPGDASSARAFRARNRVRRFQLALGPAPDVRFDVTLPEDPAADLAHFRAPYWVALPRPVPAACLTIVLTDVAPGAGAAPPRTFGTTAMSEVSIFTDLDGPEGAARLVEEVGRTADCASRVPTLVGLGEAAVLPTARALAAAPRGAARECLVEAMEALDPSAKSPAVLAAFVAALAGATETEERLVTSALARAADPPVSAIAALLDAAAAPVADRARAARVLSSLDDPRAAAALVGALGRGPDELREAVVRAAAGAHGLTLADVLAAYARAAADGARQADLLRVVPAAVARGGDGDAALATLRDAVTPTRPFEVRGRAVVALGALGPRGAPALIDVRAHADEPVLRHLAARELAAQAGDDAHAALRAALADADPRVRETAALALGQNLDRGAGAALAAGAKQEPWPFVRRAEIEALGRLCGAGDLLTRALERDVSEVRRAALVGLARCKDPRARTLLLRAVGRRNEASTLRALAAALLGELGDPTVAHDLAAALARQVNESEDDLSVEGVAAASLRTLGRLGGPDATAAAVTLARDTRHPFQQTAVETLGQLCDPGAGAATLQKLAAGPPGALALAAEAATRRCAAR